VDPTFQSPQGGFITAHEAGQSLSELEKTGMTPIKEKAQFVQILDWPLRSHDPPRKASRGLRQHARARL
jgi:hypothetical protein